MCRLYASTSPLWIRYLSILRWILVWRSCNQSKPSPPPLPTRGQGQGDLLKLLSMNQGLYWGSLVPEHFLPRLSPFIWSPAHSGLHHRLAKPVLTPCSQDICIVSFLLVTESITFLWICLSTVLKRDHSPGGRRDCAGRGVAQLSWSRSKASRTWAMPLSQPKRRAGVSGPNCAWASLGVGAGHCKRQLLQRGGRDLRGQWRDPEGGSTLPLPLLAGLHLLGSGIVLAIPQGSRGREGDEGLARHGHLLQEAPALVLRPGHCRCFCSWHPCLWSASICWASSFSCAKWPLGLLLSSGSWDVEVGAGLLRAAAAVAIPDCIRAQSNVLGPIAWGRGVLLMVSVAGSLKLHLPHNPLLFPSWLLQMCP